MFVNAHPDVIGQFLDGLYLYNLHELQLGFPDLADEPTLWPKAAILALRNRCLPPLTRVAIAGKYISEEDLIDFMHRMKCLEQLEVTYGPHDLVTPRVRGLLPHDDDAILQRRSAHFDEFLNTKFVS